MINSFEIFGEITCLIKPTLTREHGEIKLTPEIMIGLPFSIGFWEPNNEYVDAKLA